MQAAVVSSFASPPRYSEFDDPVAGSGELVVNVRAAALNNLTRMLAAGKHHSAGAPPFVPGVDGVGVADGQRVYFAFPRRPFGSMAEQSVVLREHSVALPDAVDDVTAAAAANAGMAAWASLTRRARLARGEAVLVNGAAGFSGRVALQVAKYLGARRVVATARNPRVAAELRALGADAVIPLATDQSELTQAFTRELREHGCDIVLDFLYGTSAEAFIHACIGPGQGAAEPRVRFVQIGTLAGPNITLPAAALRSSGLELLGAGLGSLSHAELVTCIGEFFTHYTAAGFRVTAEQAPLRDVESVWTRSGTERVVLTLG